MLIKYGEGLEFEEDELIAKASPEPIPTSREQEEALAEIMRHGFRAPVSGDDVVVAKIGDQVYGVYNLALRGIGIFLAGTEGYAIGSTLPELELQLCGKSFRLAGKVVHLSQDTSGPWLCGIEFLTMAPEVEKTFLRYLEKSRTRLFTDHAASRDDKR